MPFNPSHLPQMAELERSLDSCVLMCLDDPSILTKPPFHYLSLTSISSRPEDRKEIEAAAGWGDAVATVLQLLIIRADAERIQAMPGGDEPEDRLQVVDKWNRAIDRRVWGRDALQGLAGDDATFRDMLLGNSIQ